MTIYRKTCYLAFFGAIFTFGNLLFNLKTADANVCFLADESDCVEDYAGSKPTPKPSPTPTPTPTPSPVPVNPTPVPVVPKIKIEPIPMNCYTTEEAAKERRTKELDSYEQRGKYWCLKESCPFDEYGTYSVSGSQYIVDSGIKCNECTDENSLYYKKLSNINCPCTFDENTPVPEGAYFDKELCAMVRYCLPPTITLEQQDAEKCYLKAGKGVSDNIVCYTEVNKDCSAENMHKSRNEEGFCTCECDEGYEINDEGSCVKTGCGEGFYDKDGECVECPTVTAKNEAQCITNESVDVCGKTTYSYACPEGLTCQNGVCGCAQGYHLEGSVCVLNTCPAGTQEENSCNTGNGFTFASSSSYINTSGSTINCGTCAAAACPWGTSTDSSGCNTGCHTAADSGNRSGGNVCYRCDIWDGWSYENEHCCKSYIEVSSNQIAISRIAPLGRKGGQGNISYGGYSDREIATIGPYNCSYNVYATGRIDHHFLITDTNNNTLKEITEYYSTNVNDLYLYTIPAGQQVKVKAKLFQAVGWKGTIYLRKQ